MQKNLRTLLKELQALVNKGNKVIHNGLLEGRKHSSQIWHIGMLGILRETEITEAEISLTSSASSAFLLP